MVAATSAASASAGVWNRAAATSVKTVAPRETGEPGRQEQQRVAGGNHQRTGQFAEPLLHRVYRRVDKKEYPPPGAGENDRPRQAQSRLSDETADNAQRPAARTPCRRSDRRLFA
jgi:hypothetical protein